MSRKVLVPLLAALLLGLLAAPEVQAWGAYHTGYTHVGYGGVQHYGSTSVSGPYGSYSGSHYGSYGGGSSYRTGYATGSGYAGEAAGGYHYGTTSYGRTSYGYAAGAYRRW